MWRYPTHIFNKVRVCKITHSVSRMQVMSFRAESTYNLCNGKTTHCFLL